MKTSMAISPFENDPEIKDLHCELIVEIYIKPVFIMPPSSSKEEMLRELASTKLNIMSSHMGKMIERKLNKMTLEELEEFYFKMMDEK